VTAVAVFASGAGSTLRALLEHESATTPWRIELVVSDREGIGALEYARWAGRPFRVIPVSGRTPDAVARDTVDALTDHGIGLVVLAGYLRLLPPGLVGPYSGRILNVHPSLLPAFGGQGMYGDRVHHAVLAAEARVTGASVHLVDEEYDRGRILAQWPVPILPDDTAGTLAARVQEVERALYPLVVDHAARRVARGEAIVPVSMAGPHFILPPGGVGSALPERLRAALEIIP
jgi:phosphoribosylglycinamide formyltransferase 1